MYYIVHTPLVRYYQTWYELALTGNLLLLGNQQLTISTECTKLMNTWVHNLQYHALEPIHKYTTYNIMYV